MTKRLFTKKEQEQLNCNPNVQAISDKVITYNWVLFWLTLS
ncbi:hypothetical protein [Lysinibacillus sp. FJAT-14745]|nr:hypothetical protein [Lysinibacillus sp. FJAT-14745]